MKDITIQELALQIVDATLKMGLNVRTAWNQYGITLAPVVKLHEFYGKSQYDRGIIDEYIRKLEERHNNGEIKTGHYCNLRTGAWRLVEFHDTGKLEWSCPGKVSKFILNDFYERLLAEFVAQKEWHPNTRGDVIWVGRKFFAWILGEGHPDLHSVGVNEIQRFMIFCSKHMKGTGIHNVKLYLKKLCRFLADNGYLAENYEGLMSFRVSRESKLLPAAPPEEIMAVLNTIDRRIPKGKRDYAMILLGAVMGLRAVDIARLKLRNIDWKSGEIRITQSKTGKALTLPLTQDVGEAIQDYILRGRQKTQSEEIFLRIHAPFQAFADGVAIGDMYDDYRKKAELPRVAFDGNGFHSLRRGVGRNMVTSGIPVTTVAQMLGHEDIDSTKKYISLDRRHLKECALDFAGIEPGVAL